MGNLFSSLGQLPAVYIDLKNATPTNDVERKIVEDFQEKVLNPGKNLYDKFANYKDGQEFVKIAMRDTSQANKDAAWNAILPNVYTQMDGYYFSSTIATEFVNVMSSVLEIAGAAKVDFFTQYPALTKCFADCFDVCLKFDQIPIKNPFLLNDLAYFRRNCREHNHDGSFDNLLTDSNFSTIFWGSRMPFTMKVVSEVQDKYKSNATQYANVINLIGLVADCCTSICTKSDNPSQEICIIALRCLTTAIIIYDSLNPLGAFHHEVRYHYREAVDLLLNYTPKQQDLIDIVKYCTTSLSKPTTDSKIKALLA